MTQMTNMIAQEERNLKSLPGC